MRKYSLLSTWDYYLRMNIGVVSWQGGELSGSKEKLGTWSKALSLNEHEFRSGLSIGSSGVLCIVQGVG
jgi:hypothetical protein